MSQLPSPSSPRFHYRLATASDWGDIATVTQEAYAQYHLEIMEDCRSSFQQGMRSVLASNSAEMEWWVAEADHGISGAVLFCHPGATLQALDGSTITLALPEARLLAVSTSARGLGLGRTLMQICIERARDIGAPGLMVRTMPEMAAANRLCEQMGFTRRTEAGARSGPLERLVDYVYPVTKEAPPEPPAQPAL
ncbi:GNAT family N-acetyltransferase [Cupriavidus sp. AU9028]|uniref:GNAT family N-acetyltransferase n=1 Tax=Cupriavidus sp. AU9028 TaxID=2871157 RepID=UPI001C938C72|nr:GNAT family N-acetyltransferase [Cupriavidus sp. AU9028]MBY4897587.1 GNAT family N-acetyltransferase [Cupriavidus sp. AU9028]